MAWHHTLATGIAALMSVTLAAAIPAVGSAATLSSIPPLEQANLQATVEAYSGIISSHYSNSQSLVTRNSSFVDLSHVSHDTVTKMANDYREAYQEDGYKVVSASVTPQIVSQTENGDGTINVIADITTTIHSVAQNTPKEASNSVQNSLDSALTDRHVMTVRPEKNSSTGMRIIFDRVLNDAEYQESLALAPENASA